MSDINNIPCKQLKCIIYPVCKNKTKIECETLSHFLNVYFNNELKITLENIDPIEFEISNNDTVKFWKFIRTHLPLAESVTVYSISMEKHAIRDINLHMTINKQEGATFRLVSKIKKEITSKIYERIIHNVSGPM